MSLVYEFLSYNIQYVNTAYDRIEVRKYFKIEVHLLQKPLM